jgi:hypothetical protein
MENALGAQLDLWTWVRIGIAEGLFCGLGLGVLVFYSEWNLWDKTQQFVLAFGLSNALWAVLLALLRLLGATLNPIVFLGLCCAGWGVYLWRCRAWEWMIGAPKRNWLGHPSRIILWVIIVIGIAVNMYTIRYQVAALGSDGYHHTLITHLIMEHGGLPQTYEPYAPVITFTYHFGFHGYAAAIGWLSGLDARWSTLLAAQLLIPIAGLAAGWLSEGLIEHKLACCVGALVSIAGAFPGALTNWSRDTQLMGLILLSVFLGCLWQWLHPPLKWQSTPILGLLAAGLALTHYRVALMAVFGALVLIGARSLAIKKIWGRQFILQSSTILVLTGLLLLPWVGTLVMSHQQGYRVDIGQPSHTFFDINRLGVFSLNHPTNIPLIGLTFTGILIGIWRRSYVPLSLVVWGGGSLIVSVPWLAGEWMDTVSVVLALYIPMAGLISWLAISGQLGYWGHRLVWIGLGGVFLIGIVANLDRVTAGDAYVTVDDIKAMTWVKTHTPAGAYFMVNTFAWDFLPHFIVGSDAGYWLPVLAHRATVTAPMTYPFERLAKPDFLDQLNQLHAWQGHLTSPEAIAQLRSLGVTHVYVGSRGGVIQTAELLQSSAYTLVYQAGRSSVFQLNP